MVDPHDVGETLRLAGRIDRQRAAVGEDVQRGVDRVSQSARLPDLLEQPGTQPTAERGVQHRQRPAMLPAAPGRAYAQGHVCLLGVTIAQYQSRSSGHPAGALARRGRPLPPDQPRPEMLAHQREHLVVVDIAGHRDDHPLRRVAPNVKRVQLGPRHRRHRLRAADHRPAHRVVAEQRRQEHVRQRVLGVVVAHRDLLEDDVAFQLDVFGRAATVEHHIGHQVDGQRQIAVEHMRVVAGVLLGGERVELTADGIHRLRDLHGGASRRRLEQQMFQEVRGPGDRGAFVARSHSDPHPDRCGTHRGQVLGDHP